MKNVCLEDHVSTRLGPQTLHLPCNPTDSCRLSDSIRIFATLNYYDIISIETVMIRQQTRERLYIDLPLLLDNVHGETDQQPENVRSGAHMCLDVRIDEVIVAGQVGHLTETCEIRNIICIYYSQSLIKCICDDMSTHYTMG